MCRVTHGRSVMTHKFPRSMDNYPQRVHDGDAVSDCENRPSLLLCFFVLEMSFCICAFLHCFKDCAYFGISCGCFRSSISTTLYITLFFPFPHPTWFSLLLHVHVCALTGDSPRKRHWRLCVAARPAPEALDQGAHFERASRSSRTSTDAPVWVLVCVIDRYLYTSPSAAIQICSTGSQKTHFFQSYTWFHLLRPLLFIAYFHGSFSSVVNVTGFESA